MNKEEAKTLLPWFAAAALDADEARAVEAHVQASPELRRELSELQVLQESVSDVAGEPVFRPALINDALRQIDEYEATRPAPAGPNPIATAVEWLRETLVTGWIRAPGGARVAMVAQFALILVLGGVLLAPGGPSTTGEAVYTTAGAQPINGAAEAAGTALVIVFQPNITERQMRELLANVGGSIEAGPSARASYTIRIPAESDADISRALGSLRSHPDVIRYAAKSE